MKAIELLAPAKDYDSVVAAVDYGADAVYIGGAKFGARAAAGNSTEQIARAAAYAHQYGVRLHCTLNTLLYDNELAEAEQQARELIAAGVDALIVQDMALRRMSLPVELHASTQLCNMTPEQVVFLERCGFARVILERGLSLSEIKAICAATTAQVECFVHGAICVGYSGRCFLARSMSERSGNRGACSQPCRLTYDLTDGAGRVYIAGKHLLSVRDLNLSAHLGELLDAGVTSFKIEGRLKDINYIKNVVAYYRREVDRALSERPGLVRASVGQTLPDFTPDPAKSFTRGESSYFFNGRQAGVSSFDTPKSVGEFVGRVDRCDHHSFTLDRPEEFAPGDGICFGDRGTNINAMQGSHIVPNRMDGITPGLEIFRNYDHRFTLQLERSRTRRVIPVRVEVRVSEDRLWVRYIDCQGVTAEVVHTGSFELAQQPEKMETTLRAQLAKCGDTIFTVQEIEIVGSQYFVPSSLLGQVRRESLESLRAARLSRPRPHQILPEGVATYPTTVLTAEENVTNRLSEAFYRDHGVQQIVRGLDLSATTVGQRVMRSGYCLRRELGACLRENSQLPGALYLRRGAFCYALEFDCQRCEMTLRDLSTK